jgi:hypothetical protein
MGGLFSEAVGSKKRGSSNAAQSSQERQAMGRPILGVRQVAQTHLQDEGRRSTKGRHVIPTIEAQAAYEEKGAILMSKLMLGLLVVVGFVALSRSGVFSDE